MSSQPILQKNCTAGNETTCHWSCFGQTKMPKHAVILAIWPEGRIPRFAHWVSFCSFQVQTCIDWDARAILAADRSFWALLWSGQYKFRDMAKWFGCAKLWYETQADRPQTWHRAVLLPFAVAMRRNFQRRQTAWSENLHPLLFGLCKTVQKWKAFSRVQVWLDFFREISKRSTKAPIRP